MSETMNCFELANEIIFLGCESEDVIKEAGMDALRDAWLILYGYHRGAVRARMAAEEREVGLLVAVKMAQDELQKRLDE